MHVSRSHRLGMWAYDSHASVPAPGTCTHLHVQCGNAISQFNRIPENKHESDTAAIVLVQFLWASAELSNGHQAC